MFPVKEENIIVFPEIAYHLCKNTLSEPRIAFTVLITRKPCINGNLHNINELQNYSKKKGQMHFVVSPYFTVFTTSAIDIN